MGLVSFRGKILKIIDETPTVKTYRFERPEDFHFKAGQSCSLAFPDRIVPGRRMYSFSNSMADSDFFEVTIKKHGSFSSMMFSIKEGAEIDVKGPFGNTFVFDESHHEGIVLLAGGVGVAPFMSMLQYASSRGMKNELVLMFSSKEEREIIARKRLDSYMENGKKISVVYALTQEQPSGWKGEKGRINSKMIKKYIKGMPDKYKYFICGPDAFISSMKIEIKGMSVDERNIVIEEWGI